jgi:pimeloyl-ACP methyl ester carboxylesterase
MHALPRSIAVMTAIAAVAGCSGSDGSLLASSGSGGTAGVSMAATGGSPPTRAGAGGAAGGMPGASGTPGAGGTLSSGGTTGGAQESGGRATGGTSETGGSTHGGAPASGGSLASGGSTARGGSAGAAAGGRSGMGGAGTAGGNPASGGSSAAAGASSSAGASAGGMGNATSSAGCGRTPALKNSPSTANQNTLMVSGSSRQFLVRWPTTYDNTHPYRLIVDFHGAGGSDTEEAPAYFGLFALSKDTTIFAAPSANGGTWDATADLTFVDEMLKTIEADLCIDTSRVEIEGFSQGAAMVAVLACQRPGVFRAAVGHSRGGLTAPSTCQPIPYLGSLGLNDVGTNSQATQTDPFAKWNGCTVTTLPLAPTGGHVCTTYTGCPTADPVRWCSYDGGHTPSPTDAGQSSSWMPAEVWPFLSQF